MPMSDFGKCSGDCADVLRQLLDFLDEELTEERMVAVRAHLDRCAGCYPEYDFERIFLDAVAATGFDGFVVAEVLSETLRARDVRTATQLVHDAVLAVLS